MKTFFRLPAIILLFTAMILFAGCGDDDDDDNDTQADDDAVDDDEADDDTGDDDDDDDDEAPPFCEIDEARIDRLLAALTLREKVGQMYYVGVDLFPWFELPAVARSLQELKVGAVHEKVFYTLGLWPEWSVRNVNTLQTLAMNNDPAIPLLIGIDQEGGAPQAFSTALGGTDTPGNLGLGATFDPAATRDAYALMGNQLAALGINVNLAPVLEVMTSPEETSMYTRCFGEDTAAVAEHAAAAVTGLRAELVAPTAKHFPGQTAAPGDEHTDLVVSELDEATLRAVYLPPYEAAIAAGVDLIMPTHARFVGYDPDYPATLSYPILTELLREELGFEGVIITDDMNMWSLAGRDWGGMPDVMAIQAGADMIMDIFEGFEPVATKAEPYPTDIAGQIDAVVAAVENGEISSARIDESVRRILRLKMKYCLFENPFREVEGISARVDTPEQQSLAAGLHDRAVTLVRNDAALVPLSAEARVHVVAPGPVVWQMYPTASWPNLATETLVGAMREYNAATTGSWFSSPPLPSVVNRIVADAAAAAPDVLVIATYNALYDERQTNMVERLLALNFPTIIAALAMPYDLLAFPDASTYLAAYSNHDLAVEAVARILYGEASPGGRLPVAIPGMYDIGWSAPVY
ncbi:MAG TPA: glycoside hydrolase family 3 N-terminal domain-containing protein [bacterium]|nr:glycoside hydrolase family 3 N-terminal domain-containing protein [bacterium]